MGNSGKIITIVIIVFVGIFALALIQKAGSGGLGFFGLFGIVVFFIIKSIFKNKQPNNNVLIEKENVLKDNKNQNLTLELMQQIVHPSMRHFERNDIVQTLSPNKATNSTAFESFLLNCIMVMIVVEKRYKEIFINENVFSHFTFACIEYYKDEKIYLTDYDKFNEEIAEKYIFDKWSKYQGALSRMYVSDDYSEIAEMLFKPQLGLQTVADKMKFYKERLEVAMSDNMDLLIEKLPLIMSKY